MAKSVAQIEREIGDVLGRTLRANNYTVKVVPDAQRGGFSAKLVSEGAGVVMEPNGRTPQEAVARLISELRSGSGDDRKLAEEIEALAAIGHVKVAQVGYRVAHVGEGAQRVVDAAVLSLEGAKKAREAYKRRGMTAWVEDT